MLVDKGKNMELDYMLVAISILKEMQNGVTESSFTQAQ